MNESCTSSSPLTGVLEFKREHKKREEKSTDSVPILDIKHKTRQKRNRKKEKESKKTSGQTTRKQRIKRKHKEILTAKRKTVIHRNAEFGKTAKLASNKNQRRKEDRNT
jgi:hypothetical protein